MFTNNPHQEIKMGGTAATGGGGPYSASQGGFWNHILAIKLVTMTGDIITCSKRENYELLKFSLGGFGRIGIISELTVRVVHSKTNVISPVLIYHDFDTYYRDLNSAMKDDIYDAVVGQTQLNYPEIMKPFKIKAYGIGLIVEVNEKDDIINIVHNIKQRFNQDFLFFLKDGSSAHNPISLSSEVGTLHKRTVVYHHPKYTHKKQNQLNLCHAWSDYLLSKKQYPIFMEKSREIIKKYDLAKYSLKEPIFQNHFDVDVALTYCLKQLVKNSKDFFPLVLDLPRNRDYCFSEGIYLTVPSEEVEKSIAMINELTNLVYDLDGKRYLYGLSNLTPLQVEKQFGKDVIKKWQKIKDKLDPNHLLNIGVIPHLDNI